MQTDSEQYCLDPVFINSRREARFILITFAVFAIYTVGVSYLLGYRSEERVVVSPRVVTEAASDEGGPSAGSLEMQSEGTSLETRSEAPSTVLGIPVWVFWGVVIPWIGANVVTCWFCFGLMQDDSLEAELSTPVTGANDA